MIWNQAHLLRALRKFETHYNRYKTHRTLAQGTPLHVTPEPLANLTRTPIYMYEDVTASAESSTSTNM